MLLSLARYQGTLTQACGGAQISHLRPTAFVVHHQSLCSTVKLRADKVGEVE